MAVVVSASGLMTAYIVNIIDADDAVYVTDDYFIKALYQSNLTSLQTQMPKADCVETERPKL